MQMVHVSAKKCQEIQNSLKGQKEEKSTQGAEKYKAVQKVL